MCTCASAPHACTALPPVVQAAITGNVDFTCGSAAGAAPATPLNLVLKLLPAGVLWGAGTALGEIPPYMVSYSAAKLGGQVKLGPRSPSDRSHWSDQSAPTKGPPTRVKDSSAL